MTSMWAGHYAYNTIDRTHYIFRDLNVIVATGTSGSGIMKGGTQRAGSSLHSSPAGRRQCSMAGRK
ncbi:FAD-binding oxidoreductase [Thermogymnomonas acidicola]|uniref:FAD-binding oxidoreductase n=1 Tax=Thermogymnomonas acidicola TaxID=399579 RepID=UPI001494D878|nr:FAD-binding oxidoreductase [Thermogymnomonas acidicola]